MFTVYAIKSQKRNYIYVGMTNNLARRLLEHNSGNNLTTRAYSPFILIHHEVLKTRQESRLREKYFKSGFGKEWLKEKSARVAELVDAHV